MSSASVTESTPSETLSFYRKQKEMNSLLINASATRAVAAATTSVVDTAIARGLDRSAVGQGDGGGER